MKVRYTVELRLKDGTQWLRWEQFVCHKPADEQTVSAWAQKEANRAMNFYNKIVVGCRVIRSECVYQRMSTAKL